MKRTATLLLAALLLASIGSLLTIPGESHADSIWARRSQRSAFLFTDIRARRVGDLLTVRIREITVVDNDEERTMDKETTLAGTYDFSGTIGNNDADANLDSSLDSERRFEGESEFESDRLFTDELTVSVVDRLPNGNLVIEGYRKRLVANEVRWLRLSGVVRPDDIQIGNFVDSRSIANFKIAYEGGGDESSFTNQGRWGRRVNRWWPF